MMPSASISSSPSPSPILLPPPRTRTLLTPLFFARRRLNSGFSGSDCRARRKTRLGAAGSDSEYEFDRDRAMAALEQLDQQLKALADKETPPPRKKPPPPASSSSSDGDLRREMIELRAEEEISGSALAAAAVALFLLTIVNNVLFSVFVKPSVDGYELAPPAQSKPSADSLPQPSDLSR
ncbi:uncharacterized protein LOC144702015 [Wolffia australiana]